MEHMLQKFMKTPITSPALYKVKFPHPMYNKFATSGRRTNTGPPTKRAVGQTTLQSKHGIKESAPHNMFYMSALKSVLPPLQRITLKSNDKCDQYYRVHPIWLLVAKHNMFSSGTIPHVFENVVFKNDIIFPTSTASRPTPTNMISPNSSPFTTTMFSPNSRPTPTTTSSPNSSPFPTDTISTNSQPIPMDTSSQNDGSEYDFLLNMTPTDDMLEDFTQFQKTLGHDTVIGDIGIQTNFEPVLNPLKKTSSNFDFPTLTNGITENNFTF
jgi:hypothetical protein